VSGAAQPSSENGAIAARVARLELWCVVLAAMNGAQIVGHLSARWL
jgi:hypothetical protein